MQGDGERVTITVQMCIKRSITHEERCEKRQPD